MVAAYSTIWTLLVRSYNPVDATVRRVSQSGMKIFVKEKFVKGDFFLNEYHYHERGFLVPPVVVQRLFYS